MSINVEIVRPKKSVSENVGTIIGLVLNPLTSAWVVMILTPMAIDRTPGFMQSLAAVLVVRVMIRAEGDSFLTWTKAHR